MTRFTNEQIEMILAIYNKEIEKEEPVTKYNITEDQMFWYKIGVDAGRGDGKRALINIIYNNFKDSPE